MFPGTAELSHAYDVYTVTSGSLPVQAQFQVLTSSSGLGGNKGGIKIIVTKANKINKMVY